MAMPKCTQTRPEFQHCFYLKTKTYKWHDPFSQPEERMPNYFLIMISHLNLMLSGQIHVALREVSHG